MQLCARVALIILSRTHIVGECAIYKEERGVLEMRKLDECDMEEFVD